MTAIAASAAAQTRRSRRAEARPVVICLLHPKGGVARSTTALMLGAELALRGRRVVLEDLDQGRHLSRVFERHPLGLETLTLGGDEACDFTILDTAPEAQRERALDYLRRSDWVLVPVKGPEEGSVQALPLLLRWLQEAQGARLLGFLPTMYKPRRATGSRNCNAWPNATTHACFSRSTTWRASQPGASMGIRTPASPTRYFMPRAPRSAPRATFDDLDAALDERPPVDDRLVHSLPLSAIQASSRNPRHHMDGIDELADSLRTHGLLQPIVVRRRGEGYELIAGHRRLEAARKLGWREIAAVVRDETDQQAYILTLVENLQREDLSPKEEAAALEVLVRERGWTTRQVGEAIKRNHTYVSRRLRVFEDPVLAPLVLERKLPVSTAEELLRAPNAQTRQDLAERAAEHEWTWADARKAISEIGAGRTKVADLLAHLRRAIADAAQIEPESLTPAERKQVRQARAALGRLV